MAFRLFAQRHRSLWFRQGQLLIGWLTLFVIGTDLFVVSPLLPLVAGRYQISTSTAGWMVTAFSIMYMLAAPFCGLLADRLGRRSLLVAGLLSFAVANGLTGLASSFPWLLGSRLLAGSAAAAITPSIYALVSDAAPPQRRGSRLGVVGSGLLIAIAVGAPFGAIMAQALGWQTIFLGLAVASLILALVNRGTWPGRSPSPTAHKADQLPSLQAWIILRTVGPTAIWSAALYGVYTYLGAGLRTAAHFSPSQVATLLIWYGAGIVAGSLLGGYLSDRFGTRVISTISLGGLAGCFLLLSLVLNHPLLIFIGFTIAPLLAQLFLPAQQARLVQAFPNRRALLLAWNNSALYLGIALGSAIGGILLGQSTFAGLLIGCCGIGITGCLLSLILPDRTALRLRSSSNTQQFSAENRSRPNEDEVPCGEA
ncbi:MFS transporter [Ktedonosporobacter rubrisoli]|uniref:MFS transporter n=1 Tax=Ktedonosporobacter rubrisoli TaxID=2509675 RepID=A0A4P6K3R8_KTERU|nr:MFS transporter [Ktedonosporobacter rubrisoli]QBD82918.1 MFS transporter [Ktedonosporobacter rubrisoli]